MATRNIDKVPNVQSQSLSLSLYIFEPIYPFSQLHISFFPFLSFSGTAVHLSVLSVSWLDGETFFLCA